MALSILTAFPIISGGDLILDSPFPHLDSKRKKKLLDHLPEMSERVYLSLPRGSLTGKEEKELIGAWKKKGKRVVHYHLIPGSKGTIIERTKEEVG